MGSDTRIIGPRAWGAAPWNGGQVRAAQSLPSRADVVVIGGGLTGCSAAYHLSRLGIRPVVLEADLVGSGASGRTGGIVLEGSAVGPLDQANACVPGLAKLVEREQIECELRLPGCWEIEHRDGAARKLPWIDEGKPVSVTGQVPGGTVEPSQLTLGIANAASRAGGIICERARVTHIDFGDHIVVELGDNQIRTDWLIVAANAWIKSLVPDVHMASALTFACATEVLNKKVLEAVGLQDGIPFYTVDLPYLWGRITTEGRVIFGSGLVFDSSERLEQIGLENLSFARAIDTLTRRVRGLHPALADIRFSHAWAGPIAFTEAHMPILTCVPNQRRMLVAGAYAGHGVAMSVRAGELLALAVARNDSLPQWGAFSG
jgi:gamma-glutamylputrescine oxidase